MSVEKLELKHLAPYLPYGLKCEILDYKCDYVGDKYDTIKGYYFYGDSPYFNFKHGRDHAGKNTTNFKPILRPLSDLKTFEIIDVDQVVEYRFNSVNLVKLNLYWQVELLFENHFDVFGLIEKGLAIDINTIKV